MKYTPSNLPPGFISWWKIFPKKIGKGQAIRAWVSNDCEPISDEIIAATKKYPFSDEVQYIPYPATFINGWRWEDSFEGDGNDSDW